MAKRGVILAEDKVLWVFFLEEWPLLFLAAREKNRDSMIACDWQSGSLTKYSFLSTKKHNPLPSDFI